MPSPPAISPWPNRLAWALACATFPLIWVGGLVTTYGAGMAVHDWPSSFGYFLYLPLRLWLLAWDVFLEHGHRTIGLIVGMLAIALAVVLWRQRPPRWLRWMGLAALLGVCLQGILGGLRVVLNEVLLADLHGCTGPLFFALAAALVTLTSRAWQCGPPARPHPAAARLRRGAAALTILLYLQIVLGAQLRHLARLTGGTPITLWVWLHVLGALAIAAGVTWLVWSVWRDAPGQPPLRRRAVLLAALAAGQFLLGVVTWITKYGWPAWFTNTIGALEYTVVAGGRLQATMTTAHVGLGALTLVTSLSLTLWVCRSLSIE
jgi:cytochrome c oxidase assembly protein subunit 15